MWFPTYLISPFFCLINCSRETRAWQTKIGKVRNDKKSTGAPNENGQIKRDESGEGGSEYKNIEEIDVAIFSWKIRPLIASTRQQTLATFEIDSRKQKPTDVRTWKTFSSKYAQKCPLTNTSKEVCVHVSQVSIHINLHTQVDDKNT